MSRNYLPWELLGIGLADAEETNLCDFFSFGDVADISVQGIPLTA